jgi:hypothetical protein
VGSNPTQGIDVCVCVYSVFMLSCVYVAASRRADYSSKESYRLWKMITELTKRPRPRMGWKSHWKKAEYTFHPNILSVLELKNFEWTDWWKIPSRKAVLDIVPCIGVFGPFTSLLVTSEHQYVTCYVTEDTVRFVTHLYLRLH